MLDIVIRLTLLRSVPDEPLVFVHVALVPAMAPSMDYIKSSTEALAHDHDASAAIFYSISSTQPGLQVLHHLHHALRKEIVYNYYYNIIVL